MLRQMRRILFIVSLLCAQATCAADLVVGQSTPEIEAKALLKGKVTIINFWATWCGPCQVQGPIVQDVHEVMGEKAVVGKLDVDANPKTAQTFGVMSIPTLIIFKNGQPVKQFVGVQGKDVLIAELNKYV